MSILTGHGRGYELHPLSADGVQERLRHIRHVVLDMDGTIYRGGLLFQFTNGFLELLERLGIGYTLLTNNSSKSVRSYVEDLSGRGMRVASGHLCTSTQLTIRFLKEKLASARHLFLLGTPSMAEEMIESGFTLAEDDAADEPDAVVVGFDTGLNYSRLCRAAYWIKQGKPFIASHMDRICPTDEPTVLVDCGSICAALREATGRAPDAVLGKPDPGVLMELMQRKGLLAEHLVMVGDRLYTDIEMAHRAGVLGVLVLTGEASAREAELHVPPPDLVVADLQQLGEQIQAARSDKRE